MWTVLQAVTVALVVSLRAREVGEPGPAGQSGPRCRPDPAGPAVPRAAFPRPDTSAYVLPFESGRAYVVWRTTSHYTRGNGGVGLYALDFEMPVGTPLVAVRAGVVAAVRDTFPDGNDTDLQENYVMVRHADSTVARYLHLTRDGALVAVGDSVRQGQRIALSGNSGQTGGPHLHFDVQTCGPNLPPGYNRLPCGRTVPVTFRNAGPNACGLVPGLRYRATTVPAAVPHRARKAPAA
jgi:murein DD-endopeptidase MepM/ murein hydrolase activator NlpD